MSRLNDVEKKFLDISGETINLEPPNMPELPEGYEWHISSTYFDFGGHYWYLEIGKWITRKEHWWSSKETEYFKSFTSCSIFFDDTYKTDYSSVQEYIRLKAIHLLNGYAMWIKSDTEKDIVIKTINNDYRRD